MDVAAKITTIFTDHKYLRMLPSKATPTSNISKDKRSPLDATMCMCIKEYYASLVGAMIYMSISFRPGISYAVGCLSRHMHKHDDDAARDCAHILEYLNDASNKGRGLLQCVHDNYMRSHIIRMHGEHRNGMLSGNQGAITDVDGRPFDTFTDSNLVVTSRNSAIPPRALTYFISFISPHGEANCSPLLQLLHMKPSLLRLRMVLMKSGF